LLARARAPPRRSWRRPELAARLTRLDHGKGNYTARDPKVRWFELQSFNIGNGSDGTEGFVIDGDTIAVPIPWRPADATAEQLTRAEERKLQREERLRRVREIIAEAMSSDLCRLTAVLPAIQKEFSIKQAAARALVDAAIPSGEEVLCESNGNTYSLMVHREGAPHPSTIIRKLVTAQAEAA
jgi:hypothetical protein